MREVSQAATAAVLVIGDEILSGRTQDVNLATIARFLNPLGIDLLEARVVPDIESEIVAAINALRGRYTYVFTTGGIGPTHDDITTDAIASAFGVAVEYDEIAMTILAARYAPGEFNERRRRMARIPHGASLIRNAVSAAPGFQIENVFVMAGVPRIMEAMLDDIRPRLEPGVPVISRSLRTNLPEGRIAASLESVQKAHPELRIGSYPFFAAPASGGGSGTVLVVRGRNKMDVDLAAEEIIGIAAALGDTAVPEKSN
ncbi:MAG: competence/damage-inducible protein A [Alphaproteobacteria bacterium]|nr:competence/damage-inducible protein A [Alphaproteobacteria bacterium]